MLCVAAVWFTKVLTVLLAIVWLKLVDCNIIPTTAAPVVVPEFPALVIKVLTKLFEILVVFEAPDNTLIPQIPAIVPVFNTNILETVSPVIVTFPEAVD